MGLSTLALTVSTRDGLSGYASHGWNGESQKESRNTGAWRNVVSWCFLRTKFEILCSTLRDCSFGLFVKLMFQIQCLVLVLSLRECLFLQRRTAE